MTREDSAGVAPDAGSRAMKRYLLGLLLGGFLALLLFVALLNAPYVADMRRVDAAVYAGFLGAVIMYSGLAIAGQLVVQLVPALYIPVFLFNLLLLATLLGLGCTATYLPVHRRLRTNIRLKHAYSK